MLRSSYNGATAAASAIWLFVSHLVCDLVQLRRPKSIVLVHPVPDPRVRTRISPLAPTF